jgi:hypothetical protein
LSSKKSGVAKQRLNPERYSGEVQVLDSTYVGHEPIADASGAVIGACFVGYKK